MNVPTHLPFEADKNVCSTKSRSMPPRYFMSPDRPPLAALCPPSLGCIVPNNDPQRPLPSPPQQGNAASPPEPHASQSFSRWRSSPTAWPISIASTSASAARGE